MLFRSGFLPVQLARLNHRNVPSRAVALQAVLAAAFTLTSSFGALLVYIGFTLNLFSALAVVSLFRLRRAGQARVKVCFGYPFTPVLFLVFTVWMTVWSIREQPAATLSGLATLAVGYGLYLARARKALLRTEAAATDA